MNTAAASIFSRGMSFYNLRSGNFFPAAQNSRIRPLRLQLICLC
jgi:hypothetical protein